MEFISQQEKKSLTNACVILSFMEMFTKIKKDKNEKWLNILSEFWITIKDVPLEKENMTAWHELGDLIELNLTQDWKDLSGERDVLEYYIYNNTIIGYGFHYQSKFEEYNLYFQDRNWQEYKQPHYDSEEEEEKRLQIRIDIGASNHSNW